MGLQKSKMPPMPKKMLWWVAPELFFVCSKSGFAIPLNEWPNNTPHL
jgi:hypothetical protein